MRRRALATIGIGAVIGTAAAVAMGLAGDPTTTRPLDGVALPAQAAGPAAARALPAFDGCEQLRRWYVREALPRVGPWGFGGPLYYNALDSVRSSAPAVVHGEKAVASSDTGTNVQEAGVDEPDRAKTNGDLLVRVAAGHLVVTDVRGDRPRTLSRLRLPGRLFGNQELLLVGNTVLAVGEERAGWYGGPLMMDAAVPKMSGTGHTQLTSIDISDPRAPRIESRQRIDGALVGAREYADGTVRLIVSTGFPALDFVMPNRDRTLRQARRLNRDIVRRAPIEAWLPGLRQDGGGRRPLLDCTAVRHPRTPSGFGTLSILTLDAHDPTGFTATAVTAAGSLAYSSTDRIYVATLPSTWWDDVVLDRSSTSARRPGRPAQPRTTVYAFAVVGTDTRFVASGTVPGTVRDRWSFDEHDGRLRVASALGRDWVPRENAVSVLAEDGDRLRVVGSARGMGQGEQIQSVRWFDDLAVLVTFRQTDPVYTVDLTDPARPRVLGALKIPGFSSYLHPVGGDLLLGLGQDATGRGASLGAQVSTFDLRNLGHLVRRDTEGFGLRTDLSTSQDPRAFTYLPEQRTGLVGLRRWGDGRSRLVALHVAPDGRLTVTHTWRTSRWSAPLLRTLPLGGDRVALVDRGVRIIYVG